NVFLPDDIANGSGRILTFTDVAIGDAYVVDQPDPTWTPIDTTITVPTSPGANVYVASSPCSYGAETASQTPQIATELGNCTATTDFYVTAQNNSTVLAA